MAKPDLANLRQILVIQTAFIGDAILATAVLGKLHAAYPDVAIDFLVRKGNEGLFRGHPFLREVIIRDKALGKIRSLRQVLKKLRNTRYDIVVNLHRYTSSGFLAAFSGARHICGFDKKPLSWFYDQKVRHIISAEPGSPHEVERNQSVIEHIAPGAAGRPRLYPSQEDFAAAQMDTPYICVAPTSIWFTKQWPAEKWVELIRKTNPETTVCLLGAPGDVAACEAIAQASGHPRTRVLAGKLNLLQSAALIARAQMSYVNDSGPMHLASAMNAPVTAIFCSTVPAFGFGPLSDDSHIWETKEKLDCRPCGIHGLKACPKAHFRCALVES